MSPRIRKFFNQRVKVQRRTDERDSVGTVESTWSDHITPTRNNAKVRPLKPSEKREWAGEDEEWGREAGQRVHRVYMLAGQDITESDRLVRMSDNTVLDIAILRQPGEAGIHLEIDATEEVH